MASFEIRLAIRVLEKVYETEKLKESLYRWSPDVGVFVTFVVPVLDVEGVVTGGGAFEGPASSTNLTFNGNACLILWSVSSSELVIMSTDEILLKFNCNYFEIEI